MQKKNFIPYLAPDTHRDSKWITDLNVKSKTINLLEGNRGENRWDLGLGTDFLGHKKYEP